MQTFQLLNKIMAQSIDNKITFYDSDDQAFTVHGTIYLGKSGARELFARFQEPDDPDDVEITMITDEDGNEVSQEMFTDEQIDQMLEKLLDL